MTYTMMLHDAMMTRPCAAGAPFVGTTCVVTDMQHTYGIRPHIVGSIFSWQADVLLPP